jgi:hypothetical protein
MLIAFFVDAALFLTEEGRVKMSRCQAEHCSNVVYGDRRSVIEIEHCGTYFVLCHPSSPHSGADFAMSKWAAVEAHHGSVAVVSHTRIGCPQNYAGDPDVYSTFSSPSLPTLLPEQFFVMQICSVLSREILWVGCSYNADTSVYVIKAGPSVVKNCGEQSFL